MVIEIPLEIMHVSLPVGNYTHLTRHSDLPMMLKAHGALGAVRIVENDGYAGLGDTSLPTFVDEVLLVCRAHLHAHDHYT